MYSLSHYQAISRFNKYITFSVKVIAGAILVSLFGIPVFWQESIAVLPCKWLLQGSRKMPSAI